VIPGRKDVVYKEHLNIYQAIKEHDPQKAKEALLFHLKQVKQNVQANSAKSNE
jgi:GntR family transcriptional repressor for pyruvate dehydrogenase complex